MHNFFFQTHAQYIFDYHIFITPFLFIFSHNNNIKKRERYYLIENNRDFTYTQMRINIRTKNMSDMYVSC